MSLLNMSLAQVMSDHVETAKWRDLTDYRSTIEERQE
jgi:hypothetical protein